MTGSCDTTWILWKTKSYHMLHLFPAHKEGVNHLQPVSSSHLVVSCGGHYHTEIKVWDVSKWSKTTHTILEKETSMDENRKKYALALNPLFSPEMTLDVLSMGFSLSHIRPINQSNKSWCMSCEPIHDLLVPLPKAPYALPTVTSLPESDEEMDSDVEDEPRLYLRPLFDPESVLHGASTKIGPTVLDPKLHLKVVFQDRNDVRFLTYVGNLARMKYS